MLESTPVHWFRCIYREFKRFLVYHKKFLRVLKLLNKGSILGTNMIFLFTFIKARLMLIQNNTYCWIETTTWNKIKKSPKYKFQSLLYKIRAASDINQKEHFILKKRTPRILPSSVQYLFYVFYIKRKLYVISQNGAASNCWTNKRSRLGPGFYNNIGNLSIRSL